MKVYVYKEYNDRYAYGEEVVEVYANEKDAKARLKGSVEEYFDTSWENVEAKAEMTEDDTFSDTYVSYNAGSETVFWCVNMLPVK